MLNADVVHALYRAVAAGDPAAAAAALAPDAVLHVPGSHPLAGDHTGVPSILAFLARTRAASDSGEEIGLVDVMTGHEHVAAYCRVRADRGPDSLDNHTVHLLRIADGRVAEIWFHNREQDAVDAFWGGAA